MKLSTFTSTVAAAVFLFASKAVANVEYFDYPMPNEVFDKERTIQVVVDDMPDGDRVYADLFTASGRFIRTIRSWEGNQINNGDEFTFSWAIDRNLKSGRYFIEIYSGDDGYDDDVSRSYIFEIAGPKRSNNNNRSGRKGGEKW